ncbi:MAG TPA: transcriptional regulator [Lachnospiraceae bacterium]|nr:transcriptional regulator [Lachnospiraceae bacterium]
MGKILLIEFTDDDKQEFEEIITFLNRYPHFEKLLSRDETVISFPGWEIRPERRTVYCDCQKVHLTTKEFDILCLLVANKGQVLTYEQIYQRVWGDFPSGGINGTVSFHVRNLRKKLSKAPSFSVRCTREVGYCFEIESEK